MRSRADATPSFLLLPEIPEPGAELVLPADEAHYAARVCRVRAGERVQATDGRGALATLAVLDVRGGVRARVEGRAVEAPRRAAHVLCGAPEGRRADWLVEKLAELGVGTLTLVDAERARWPAAARPERLERLAAAALRQSRRRWRLAIEGPRPLAAALAALGDGERWLADPEGERRPPVPGAGRTVGAIGPAEGFSEAERTSLVGCGFRLIALADARLRCETAAIAWASWWALGGAA